MRIRQYSGRIRLRRKRFKFCSNHNIIFTNNHAHSATGRVKLVGTSRQKDILRQKLVRIGQHVLCDLS